MSSAIIALDGGAIAGRARVSKRRSTSAAEGLQRIRAIFVDTSAKRALEIGKIPCYFPDKQGIWRSKVLS